jgi:hypothetical protein
MLDDMSGEKRYSLKLYIWFLLSFLALCLFSILCNPLDFVAIRSDILEEDIGFMIFCQKYGVAWCY